MYEGIDSATSDAVLTAIRFWAIMMRYIPFDVILQTEAGKIIYCKFMEWDAQMVHIDYEAKQ